MNSIKNDEPIGKKEEVFQAVDLNNKRSTPNYIDSNIIPSDSNILETMQKTNFNYNFGERRDSIQIREAKKKTAEEQVKFFEKKISENEKTIKDENLILVDTESNMVKNGEEPLKSIDFY